LQDKQSTAPQQVEDTEYVDLGPGVTVSMNLNPITELQRRLETKLNALDSSQKSAKECIPALRKYLSKNKQNG
jgi:ribose 5-phosphate isomerase